MLKVLWIYPLFVLFIGLALFLGQYRPVPQESWFTFGFAACKLPCWAGIALAETSMAHAEELLGEALPAPINRVIIGNYDSLLFSIGSERAYFNGSLISANGGVAAVYLHNVSVPLWYLFQELGKPSCMWMIPSDANSITSAQLWWEQAGTSIEAMVVIKADTAGQFPLSPLTTTQDLRISKSPPVCMAEGAAPWGGFAPLK